MRFGNLKFIDVCQSEVLNGAHDQAQRLPLSGFGFSTCIMRFSKVRKEKWVGVDCIIRVVYRAMDISCEDALQCIVFMYSRSEN